MKKFVNLLLATALLVTSIEMTVSADEEAREPRTTMRVQREYNDNVESVDELREQMGSTWTNFFWENPELEMNEVVARNDRKERFFEVGAEYFELMVRPSTEVQKDWDLQKEVMVYDEATREITVVADIPCDIEMVPYGGMYEWTFGTDNYNNNKWKSLTLDALEGLNQNNFNTLDHTINELGTWIDNVNKEDGLYTYNEDTKTLEPMKMVFLGAYLERIDGFWEGELKVYNDYVIDTKYYAHINQLLEEWDDGHQDVYEEESHLCKIQQVETPQVLRKNLNFVRDIQDYAYEDFTQALLAASEDETAFYPYYFKDTNYIVTTIKIPEYDTICKLAYSVDVYTFLNSDETDLYIAIQESKMDFDLSDDDIKTIFEQYGYTGSDIWQVNGEEFRDWAAGYGMPEEVTVENSNELGVDLNISSDTLDAISLEDITVDEKTGEISVKNSDGSITTSKITEEGIITTTKAPANNTLTVVLLIALIVAVAAVIYLLYTKNKKGELK